MIKYFCDVCEKELRPEDRNVFIRLYNRRGIFVSALAVTGDSKPVDHICHICILSILTNGEAVTAIRPVQAVQRVEHQITPMVVPTAIPPASVATLQPAPAIVPEHKFDQVAPAPTTFEPSLPLPSENPL